MSQPGDANQKPRMEGDTAPLLVAREYMESIGMGPMEPVTEPLPKSTRPLMDPAMFRRAMEAALLKAEKLYTGTEARVELLVASLNTRKVLIPGVTDWPMRHPVSPNGKNIITYLSKRYAHVPQLEKDVQLACSRFWEFGVALEACRVGFESGNVDEAMLEDLKLKTYFVANFYDHFKDDPLMRQLYPPPPEPPKPRTGPIGAAGGQLTLSSQGGASGGAGGTDSITRYRQQRESAVRRAENVLKVMGPAIERIRHVHGLGKQERGASLLGMLNPMDMRERQLVKRLRDAKLFEHLEAFVKAVDTANTQLPKVREGAPYELLEEAIKTVAGAQAEWATQPGLNELLPPPS